MDKNGERAASVADALNAFPVQGDGAEPETLRTADIETTDLLVATTDSDETNLVTCGTAKTVHETFTIARVKNAQYLQTWTDSPRAYGVDFMVCPTLLTARHIVEITEHPGARDVNEFADGAVLVAEYEIPGDSPLVGKDLETVESDDLRVAARVRADEVGFPSEGDTVQAGDRLVVVGPPASLRSIATEITGVDGSGPDEVVIIGGTQFGYHTARLLEESGVRLRFIESDADRASELAERLADTVVMLNDSTDVEFLAREHIDTADVVVAVLPADEMNLLVSLLTAQLGTKQTIAVMKARRYAGVFDAAGVDVPVNPSQITIEAVSRFTEDTVEHVASVTEGRAQAIEAVIDEDSVLAGSTVGGAPSPANVRVGALVRSGEVIEAGSDVAVDVGDRVVAVVLGDRRKLIGAL